MPCRDSSRTGEAVCLLRALPGSPCGMKRAQRRSFPDTQLHNAALLSVELLAITKKVAAESTRYQQSCMLMAYLPE